MLSLTCFEKNGIELIVSHMGCVQFPFDSLAKICSINLATPISEEEVVDYFRKSFVQDEANYKRYVNTIELIPSVTGKKVSWKGFSQWISEPEHLNGYIVETLNSFHSTKTIQYFNPVLYNQARELGWNKFLYELVSFDGEKNEKKEPEKSPDIINTSNKGLIYLVGDKKFKVLKIGYTTNIKQRLKALQNNCPHKLEILKIKEGSLQQERELLEQFKDFKIRGEWFTWDNSIIAAF